MRSRLKQIIVFSAAWAVLVASLLLRRDSQVQFSSSRWKRAAEKDAGGLQIRQLMLRDLVEEHLQGREESDVRRLLGSPMTGAYLTKPDGSRYFEAYDADCVYFLGMDRTFFGALTSREDVYLLLRFDNGGEFSSFYVVGPGCWRRTLGRKAYQFFTRTPRLPDNRSLGGVRVSA